MPVEFSSAGREARERIQTPTVPLAGIRHRAGAADRRQRVAFASVLAALVFASVSVGTGAAQRAYQGIRIWISGSRGAIQVRSLAIIRDPMADDIRAVARSATFPVIFPSGVPARTRVVRILYSPADHPDTITVQYAPVRGRQFGVTMVQTSSIDHNGLPAGSREATITLLRAGRETIVTPAAYPLPAFLKFDEPASKSERANETFAAPIHIMESHAPVIVAAERIAGANSGAVLIGRQIVSQIPRLARKRKALLDDRHALLTDIPTVKGMPDYANATMRWPKSIALDKRGVQAVNAFLQHHPCTCPMLVIPSGTGYTIEQFDLKGNVL